MINRVEDAIVGALKARFETFAERLRTIETIGANFSLDELTKRRNLAPAIYVAFLGGERTGGQVLMIRANFAIFVLVAGVAGEDKRRRGSTAQRGAYAILVAAMPAVEDLRVPDVGTVSVDGVDNLFSEQLDALGVSLYSIRMHVPMPIDAGRALDDLGDFLLFHDDILLAPHTMPEGASPPLAADQADAQDNTTLQGA